MDAAEDADEEELEEEEEEDEESLCSVVEEEQEELLEAPAPAPTARGPRLLPAVEVDAGALLDIVGFVD